MHRATLVLCSVLALSAPVVWAQDRVLLEPLSATEEADARTRNGYFIPKETFVAKQYRLVKVNMELLETDGDLVIPLFDGDEIVARSTEVEINELSGYLVWHGERDPDPNQPSWDIIEQALADQGVSSEAARFIYNNHIQQTQVKVNVSYHEKDKETGANLNPVIGLLDAISPCQENRYAKYESDPNYVRGASASITSLDNEKSYRLVMLGMGGPYHILYEIDVSRYMIPGNDVILPGQPYVSGLTPEQEQRNATLRQEWSVIEQTIGENPHDALYEHRIQMTRESDAKRLREAQTQQTTPVIQRCQTD